MTGKAHGKYFGETMAASRIACCLAGGSVPLVMACTDMVPLGEEGGVPCSADWVEPQTSAAQTDYCSDGDAEAIPPFRAWIDDFAGTRIPATEAEDLVPTWRMERDNTGSVRTRWEPTTLDPWGSHAPSPGTGPSMNGMRIAACSGQAAAKSDAHAWGVKWALEALRTENEYATQGFDWSGFEGIVLWMRRTGTVNTQGRFLVDFPTPDTVPASMNGNGNCTEAGDPGKIDPTKAIECYAHWSYHPDIPLLPDSTCWKPYKIEFSKLVPQFSPGPSGEFKKENVLGIQILFPVGGYDTGLYWPFDFLIDDIYLY